MKATIGVLAKGVVCSLGFLIALPGLVVCFIAIAVDHDAGAPVDAVLNRMPVSRL